MTRAPIQSVDPNADDGSLAIVTPSYPPDLRRCELLAESLDNVMPGIAHYLIVDRRDRAAFMHLAKGNRRVVESETLISKHLWRMPGRMGYWLSLKAPPVRGWILQQIKKIAAIDAIPERTLIYSDSDTAFLRGFSRADLLVDGKIGLLDVDFCGGDTVRWTSTARRLLGLPDTGAPYRNHVGYMVCWNRETVLALRERIEASTGLNWQIALARTANFSEYMLYGVFVRELLGYSEVDHAPSVVPLVKGAWGPDLTRAAAMDEFFRVFDPRTLAVMIHSKDGIDPASFRPHLENCWRATRSAENQGTG